jgi:hypothetical protein
MPSTFRMGSACVLFLGAASYAHAQLTPKLSAPQRIASATVSIAPPTPGFPTAPSNLVVTGGSNNEIDLAWGASTEEGGTITKYGIQRCLGQVADCTDDTKFKQIDTSPTTYYSDSKSKLDSQTTYTYRVTATDANGHASTSNVLSVTTASSGFTCFLFPTRSGCMDFGPTAGLDKNTKISTSINSNINTFYQTTGPYTFFNQIKSIYNGASGSATVSADLATLNFPDGMQVTFATNVQAGPSGTTTVSSATVPTLTANGAGQATQNIIYGGTFVASELYPLFAAGSSKWGSPGGVGVIVDGVVKEGADVQNFKSGANVNVTSPPFHGSGQIEGYLQYNSVNLIPNSQNFAGSLFVGGSYGYSYMSHGYARDYGFGSQVSNGIGQISLGMLINGVAKITVSRAFGPSQTYIDSTTKAQTTANNFKAWSFGVTYQSPSPAK